MNLKNSLIKHMAFRAKFVYSFIKTTKLQNFSRFFNAVEVGQNVTETLFNCNQTSYKFLKLRFSCGSTLFFMRPLARTTNTEMCHEKLWREFTENSFSFRHLSKQTSLIFW